MKLWRYILGFLTLVLSTLLLAIFYSPDPNLHIIACDVGQGDAILVIHGKTQILVDGGTGRQVLDCLGKYMPFTDRVIEAVVLSHPQKDHYGGLLDVLNAYDVDAFIATPLDSGSQDYQVLKSLVGGQGVRVINPSTGMVIRFGLIHLDILWPLEEYVAENSVGKNIQLTSQQINQSSGVLGAYTTSKDPNDFSLVAILKYKEFDALLTGDIGPDVSDMVAETLVVSGSRAIEYIKIPHHGSKNGLTKSLLDVTMPQIAVISSGRNNRYGHPHEEVLKMLEDFRDLPAGRQVKLFRTDEVGDIKTISDGKRWWVVE